MTSIANFGKKILTYFCQQGIADRANFLKNIGVIGWALSSLAQTTALVLNDKIPSKEKKFLISQEIIDGITNVTLFWFITSKMTTWGKLFVLKKHILPKSIGEIMKNFSPKKTDVTKLKDAFINHIKKFGTLKQVKIADNAIEGMGVFFGIIGSVLAYNVITPLIRNKLASIMQNKELINNNQNLNPYFGNIDYKKYKFDTLPSYTKTPVFKEVYKYHDMKI